MLHPLSPKAWDMIFPANAQRSKACEPSVALTQAISELGLLRTADAQRGHVGAGAGPTTFASLLFGNRVCWGLPTLLAKLTRMLTGDSLLDREWSVSPRDYWIPTFICAILVLAWVFVDAGRSMSDWAVSAPALRNGAYSTLLLHMIAHGGMLHVLMNGAVLILIGGPLHSRLGKVPIAGVRFLYIFIGSGLSGCFLFLAMNAGESVSMLGASGAIFGSLAALARVHPVSGAATSVVSPRTWQLAGFFALNHVGLFAILAVLAFIWGQITFVAWEAHLGGALFGFFLAPLFLPHTNCKDGQQS